MLETYLTTFHTLIARQKLWLSLAPEMVPTIAIAWLILNIASALS
jgi:hypothetical protein